ncbi:MULTISPECIES: CDGSH iron-sulfur domain-containing protein [Brevibacillus]|uniref:CDGSH iron-sulfur domain-containing protein n=1 Tax=Brevibacillus TaxID=55080 RepID=UPI0009D9FD3A|nr:CDGSH iron-sulfur domain-containing protein [Brevibacillus borstelensis]MBE5396374.1 CDGSH iron-sulfur domain-containing protein [Brevibacillus borstelensis]MCC0565744.1 CDGSH iron-sulfur domain-containing protein [Brevibacillus borstelensis]MCM3472533.1 CDGSH iron-sulfur domain-containing protein [Brevibacillus borstelensis]MCM3560470.1 CDGSH iron-sulfur domain-containing protein [Brevibacillus borstelensis]MCM3593931.1 CDGSH iron-sulfur domain-containing protein [Brevibacillus borstelensi
MENEKVTIKINDNGSIRVNGNVDLIDALGGRFEAGSTFSLCRCGHSEKKPFCDGTHKKIGFESAPRAGG